MFEGGERRKLEEGWEKVRSWEKIEKSGKKEKNARKITRKNHLEMKEIPLFLIGKNGCETQSEEG